MQAQLLLQVEAEQKVPMSHVSQIDQDCYLHVHMYIHVLGLTIWCG